MCLSAIYWSRINKVYYANTRFDAANIGFSDNFIYEELSKNNNEKEIELIKIDNTDAINTFNNWDKNNEKIKY
jgi:tRNA(Arg) A34 adenosine deaminase TadA